MTKIQPVVFPILGTATKLSVQVSGFSTSAKTATTYYRLLTEEDELCIEGNYQMTEAQFAAWGSDNKYVDQIVAAHIPVVIVPQFIDEGVDVSDGGFPQVVVLGPPSFL